MSPKTTVQKKANGQYVITIPREFAEAMDLEGERVEWSVESRNRLSFAPPDR